MKRRTPLILAGICLAALLLRLPRFLAADVVLTEGTTYATIARNLAAGNGYIGILGVRDFFVPPLYPLLMSGLVRLGLDAVFAGRLISLVLGALIPLPLYWMAREASGRRDAGLLAAALAAGHPLLITYSSRAWSEILFTFLVWCGLCFTWATLRHRRPVAAVLAGLCCGAGYLTRHEGLIYLGIFIAMVVGLWLCERRRRGNSPRQVSLLALGALSLGAFSLLAAPYVDWLSGQAGRFLLETKSVPNFVTAERMADGLSYVEAAYGLSTTGEPAGPFLFRNELIISPPSGSTLTLMSRLRSLLSGLGDEARILSTQIGSPLALVIGLLGLLAGHWDLKRLRSRGFALLFSASLALLLPGASKVLALIPLAALTWDSWDARSAARAGYLLAFAMPIIAVVALVPRVYTRYLTAMVGYVAVWSGIGLSAALRWARSSWDSEAGWKRLAMFAITLICLILVLHSIQGGALAFRPPRAVADLDQRQAGEWLAIHDSSLEKRILSVHSQLPYYAHGVHVPMPYATPELVQVYAGSQDVDYAVVSARKLTSRPLLSMWADGEDIPDDWREVYRDPSSEVVIYSVR